MPIAGDGPRRDVIGPPNGSLGRVGARKLDLVDDPG
jgi:hypothetical protein